MRMQRDVTRRDRRRMPQEGDADDLDRSVSVQGRVRTDLRTRAQMARPVEGPAPAGPAPYRRGDVRLVRRPRLFDWSRDVRELWR